MLQATKDQAFQRYLALGEMPPSIIGGYFDYVNLLIESQGIVQLTETSRRQFDNWATESAPLSNNQCTTYSAHELSWAFSCTTHTRDLTVWGTRTRNCSEWTASILQSLRTPQIICLICQLSDSVINSKASRLLIALPDSTNRLFLKRVCRSQIVIYVAQIFVIENVGCSAYGGDRVG